MCQESWVACAAAPMDHSAASSFCTAVAAARCGPRQRHPSATRAGQLAAPMQSQAQQSQAQTSCGRQPAAPSRGNTASWRPPHALFAAEKTPAGVQGQQQARCRWQTNDAAATADNISVGTARSWQRKLAPCTCLTSLMPTSSMATHCAPHVYRTPCCIASPLPRAPSAAAWQQTLPLKLTAPARPVSCSMATNSSSCSVLSRPVASTSAK